MFNFYPGPGILSWFEKAHLCDHDKTTRRIQGCLWWVSGRSFCPAQAFMSAFGTVVLVVCEPTRNTWLRSEVLIEFVGCVEVGPSNSLPRCFMDYQWLLILDCNIRNSDINSRNRSRLILYFWLKHWLYFCSALVLRERSFYFVLLLFSCKIILVFGSDVMTVEPDVFYLCIFPNVHE